MLFSVTGKNLWLSGKKIKNKGKNPIPGGEAGLCSRLTTIIKPVTITNQ